GAEATPMILAVAVCPSTAAGATLTARQKRAAQPALAQWALSLLAAQLPLRFPVPSDLPPSPKDRYRSDYRPPDPTALPDPTTWATLSDFELTLLLLDFSALEALLAAPYRQSRKGQVPFHPVSLFLAVCLRRELALSWAATARLLASEHGARWRS